jgi:hypothetical protein
MGKDVLDILLLALASMLNPTLLAAVTLMLLLEKPSRLMLGYLLGAYVTSIGLGLLIVGTLSESGFAESSEKTVAPATDLVLGGLLLIVAWALSGDRGAARAERRRQKKAAAGEKKKSLPERLLGRGSPRIAFVVGVALSFPGASYLAGLSHIIKLEAGTAAEVALVVGFCLVQLTLLELPLLGYAFSPAKTEARVAAFRVWIDANGHRMAIRVAVVLGGLLILRGLITIA